MTRPFAACAFVALLGASASAETLTAPSQRQIDLDRYNAEQAAAIVTADEQYFQVAASRTDELTASWRHDVAANHPRRAGFAAKEHFKALQAEGDARAKLVRARNDLTVAREKLILDEYTAQHSYALR